MNLLSQIAKQLSSVYDDGEARALARMVLEERFHLSQTDILLGKDNELSAEDHAEIEIIVARLLQKEPIQYILGRVAFCNHTFIVRPGVLIPRPETQELVRLVLKENEARSSASPHSVLDIGTGSGCIALSLASERLQATAWDISDEALAVARENAEALHVDVLLEKKDILHIEKEDRQWDFIVSNPPYVRQSEAQDMDDNVLSHEPHLALFVSDDDPLVFYRAIAQFALTHLRDGGMLFFEINQYLGDEMVKLLTRMGYTDVRLLQDFRGNDRMIKCHRL